MLYATVAVGAIDTLVEDPLRKRIAADLGIVHDLEHATGGAENPRPSANVSAVTRSWQTSVCMRWLAMRRSLKSLPSDSLFRAPAT